MKVNSIDILAFGAHPDDVELGCGGTILSQISLGQKVGVIDLTEGELGTRGNQILRKNEATNASKALGLEFRENLGLSDGFFEINKANILEVIKRIRHYKPKIVLCNAKHDRHPDHGRGAKLIYDAFFLAGLEKISTFFNGNSQAPYRPKLLYNYLQFNDQNPDFIVDISKFIDKKMEIVKLYASQFYDPLSKETETLISKKNFLEIVKSRSADLGRFINVDYAEGFCVNKYIGVNDLNHLL
ncbi:MAG: bacillithiol biosynthesis deacetylase BshB1 [Flavobacteriales bacterium]|nr:bacillithiol biosynthesis deacetylase BshB1 [Flavobacteriales bacterium]|tara:strand:- start:35276 stop:36001 length:726 start_codon:yes stop_codon:yes gene_type:complete